VLGVVARVAAAVEHDHLAEIERRHAFEAGDIHASWFEFERRAEAKPSMSVTTNWIAPQWQAPFRITGSFEL
jgi:hypothetical protein